jgi:selenide, water dikinase
MQSLNTFKLTSLASCAGCAAKIAPGSLAQVLKPLANIFPSEDYPALLVGLTAPDDAAIYQLDSEKAIISTTDFFPPVVDDPYSFGAIAAANALSDIYAVGGEPIMAINLVAFPDDLDQGILSEILRGGAEKVRESGAVVAGGHTIVDREPKFGLAVTGVVHPKGILTKGGALPGDKLILTKPLGAGVVTTASKQDKAQPEHTTAAIASMSRLNRDASRLAQKFGVHAMTDVTGYSLLGHAHEMAHLGSMDFKIFFRSLRWLPGAEWYGEQGIFPGGMGRNRNYFSQWTVFDESITVTQQELLFDPETSGGLLMAVDAAQADLLCDALIAAGDAASIIGEVELGNGMINVAS